MQGILFKEDVFDVILKGKKTQTRRLIRKLPDDSIFQSQQSEVFTFTGPIGKLQLRPRYKIGEPLYLKEPYLLVNKKVIYKFDLPQNDPQRRLKNYWNNKLYMPQKHARYFIEISNVEVEQYLHISERYGKAVNNGDEKRWFWVYTFHLA